MAMMNEPHRPSRTFRRTLEAEGVPAAAAETIAERYAQAIEEQKHPAK